MKYLDSTGLAYFWGHIVNHVSQNYWKKEDLVAMTDTEVLDMWNQLINR